MCGNAERINKGENKMKQKSISKSLITMLIAFAVLLSAGILLIVTNHNKCKKDIFAFTSNSAMIKGRGYEGGQYGNTSWLNALEYDITNLKVTNIADDRIGTLKQKQSLDMTDTSQGDLGNVTCYVFEEEDGNSVKYYDCVIYSDSQVIKSQDDFMFTGRLNGGPGYSSRMRSLKSCIFNNYAPINCSYMFYYCRNLETIDLRGLNTSNCIDMSDMFGECSGITSLDVSNFDTSQVTSMSGMFGHCSNLTALDLSNFDTTRVTNLQNMFYNCSSLTQLDLSNFNTSIVTSVNNTFYDCSNLATLDISSWDLSLINVSAHADAGFLQNCSSLDKIYLPMAVGEGTYGLNGDWYYDDVSYSNYSSCYLSSFSEVLSTETEKHIIYKGESTPGTRQYIEERTSGGEETGVFVDIVLPTMFVGIVFALGVMYLNLGKKKKLALR